MPLQVSRVAIALSTRPSGSSAKASAISLPRPAEAGGGARADQAVNSSEPSEKRPRHPSAIEAQRLQARRRLVEP